MFLYNKIKEARKEKSLTQKQLADLLEEKGFKVTHATISNWELNISKPDADTIQALCQILNKDGNYFFDFNDNFKYASAEGIDINGLDEEDIEELKRFAEFIRNKKNNK